MIDLTLPAGPLRLVCLGAHPDDIEIGCGATLLALSAGRALDVDYVVMTGTAQRIEEARAAAAAVFGSAPLRHEFPALPDGRLPAHWGEVKQVLERVAAADRGHPPHIVFAPRIEDAHQDHRLLARLAPTVWRDALVLHYELPKWDGDLQPVSHYVPASDAVLARKVELLDSCFPSQHGHDWWDREVFSGLMRLRGMECRSRYAEGFTVTKARLAV